MLQKNGAMAGTQIKEPCKETSGCNPYANKSCINDEVGNLEVKETNSDLLLGTELNVCFDADGPFLENNGIDHIDAAFDQHAIVIPPETLCNDIPFSIMWD
mmetsp:Transcript_69587/g.103575  ORF Transcript_69587/g.103575 Transcript_69587/m.103575 type:complete len:101 (+) Transcript_69587:1-303(+)